MNMVPTIGIETHVELNTNSKMFCNCAVVETENPNENLCPTCLGLPGALPVPNLKAIESITMLALSANCSITKNGMFHRKNYFYPDLPKNYQISQFDLPVGVDGSLEIILDETKETVEIERVHMEEDTGKSIHKGTGRIDSATSTLLDFNRSGVPLVEIVTKPVIKSSKEAVSYIEELRQLVIDLKISEGKLEKGNLRFDANISVAKENDNELGVKVEIKNMNSLRSLEKAIDYEIERQTKLIESNEVVIQETRHWDEDKEVTSSMRSKEGSSDYRYFPDPDLLPVNLSQEQIDKIKPLVGELPQDKLNKYIDNYSLDKDIAKIIIAEKQNANLFEKMISESTVKPKFIAAWLVGDIFAFIKENNLEVNSLNDKTKDITDLLRLISDDVISNKAGKEILPKVLNGEGKPSELVKELGLEQVSDSGELEKIIDEALVGEEENILKFQGGSDRVLGYFVGKCLKATKGKGNPKLINKILLERLNK